MSIDNKNTISTSLVPFQENWRSVGRMLTLGHRTVKSLAEEFRTPLYLYDASMAVNRLNILKQTFPKFEVFYFAKANPNPDLVRSLVNNGANLSLGLEIDNNGLPQLPNGAIINFCRPANTLEEFTHLLSNHRVDNFVLNSAYQLRLLEQACKTTNTSQSAILRINTRLAPESAGERMTGRVTQFGMNEETVVEELKAVPLKRVQLQGVHVHSASHVLNPDEIVANFDNIARVAMKISQALRFPLKIINFGGGIGVQYSRKDQKLDLFDLGQRINSNLNNIFTDPRNRPRFQIEPGSFLGAECGIFVTEIMAIQGERSSDGERVPTIYTDGDATFSRPAMPWAQPHPVSIVTKEGIEPTEKYFISGRYGGEDWMSGFPLQVGSLPHPEVGELLAFHNAGA